MSVRKNDKFQIEITGMTTQGSGVGHLDDGFAVFVVGGIPGDVLDVHVIFSKKSYAAARIDKIVKPSDDRLKPDCKVFLRCGGCAYRHMDYNAEMKAKVQQVKDAMQRIGKIHAPMETPIPATQIDRYRNKAQVAVGLENGKLAIGFYAPRSHRIVNTESCKLQPKLFDDVVAITRAWIEKFDISIYHEEEHRGLLRNIYMRFGEKTGQLMVCAVINGRNLPHANTLIDELKTLPEFHTFLVNTNTEQTNVVLGERYKTLYGSGTIEDELCNMRVTLSPDSFYQIHRGQTELLYAKAKEYANLSKNDVLLDMYCGIGVIGLSMASDVKQVVGVESVYSAVQNAIQNAKRAGITNAHFMCMDAAQAATQIKGQNAKVDVVILDPPRAGAGDRLVRTIASMAPKRIVYVSCDPATLARDCADFKKHGYNVQKYVAVDMFPRTAHVECVVLMSRVGK